MGACGFRSRGNDRQGRRLGGTKVERGFRSVSEAAPCPTRAERGARADRVLRDAVRADIFRGAGGAGFWRARAKFADAGRNRFVAEFTSYATISFEFGALDFSGSAVDSSSGGP
jgi:hypothetical protein